MGAILGDSECPLLLDHVYRASSNCVIVVVSYFNGGKRGKDSLTRTTLYDPFHGVFGEIRVSLARSLMREI